ncbi:hypothetical protein QAD02_008115 [Eretmocerus hayati]|uniref:Uncharacterized protein n=1 Tax=Eretmocerus hayati TaxID=131215 RepID=A0ACC2N6V8_9HYME|nr:hypothetical protein QAD02_008115 [Eretmocerus hayati]
MSKSQCKIHPDQFCHVCGTLTFKGEIQAFIPSSISLHHSYSNRDVSDQDESYMPHGVCATCNRSLGRWSIGEWRGMPFGTLMIWAEPSNHPDDCYFCSCPFEGYNRGNRKNIQYPDFTSSRRPSTHGPRLPVPPAPWTNKECTDEDCVSGTETIDFVDPIESPAEVRRDPLLIDQGSLDDSVRGLGLTKEEAQLFGSRLQERNCLAPSTTFSQYRYREEDFAVFFAEKAVHKRRSLKRRFGNISEE